jgi:hypothetical protein
MTALDNQTIRTRKNKATAMNTAQTSSATSRQSGSIRPTSATPAGVSLLDPTRKEKMALSQEEIAKKAYEIWLSLGQEPGQDQKHWFEAERQLRQQLRRK